MVLIYIECDVCSDLDNLPPLIKSLNKRKADGMDETTDGLTCTVESILNECLTTKITPATRKNRKRKSGSPTQAEALPEALPESLPDASSHCGVEESVEEVRMRFSQGCECQDQSCFHNINPESVYKHRLNIAELTRSEHDMYLMGVTMASLSNPQKTARHTQRKRLRTQYVYQVLSPTAKSTSKSTWLKSALHRRSSLIDLKVNSSRIQLKFTSKSTYKRKSALQVFSLQLKSTWKLIRPVSSCSWLPSRLPSWLGLSSSRSSGLLCSSLVDSQVPVRSMVDWKIHFQVNYWVNYRVHFNLRLPLWDASVELESTFKLNLSCKSTSIPIQLLKPWPRSFSRLASRLIQWPIEMRFQVDQQIHFLSWNQVDFIINVPPLFIG